MSIFRFRLATLLRLRHAERDERRSDLEQSLSAADTLRRQRQALNAEQDDNVRLLRRLAGPGSGNVGSLLQAHHFGTVLKARNRRLAQQEAQAEQEIERRRLLLVEADQQVRVLEKLAERQAAEHQRRADKLELRRLDEVASVSYLRAHRAQEGS
ncbi:MAG TPA: flagellar export protein FliJ [Pirellulaceae bacterium]|jgi:flagellar protein FliJ|nr:flagellar export protein FliJ [Pirellulaceae bacterium]